MYRLFSESIKNYLLINQGEKTERLALAKPLLLLTDFALYEKEKEENTALYRNVKRILENMSSFMNQSGVKGTIAWELTCVGYELNPPNSSGNEPEEETDETLKAQMKLIDLFLYSTVYWGKGE